MDNKTAKIWKNMTSLHTKTSYYITVQLNDTTTTINGRCLRAALKSIDCRSL